MRCQRDKNVDYVRNQVYILNSMNILTLVTLPGVALSVTFDQSSQGITDISTVVIPADADFVDFKYNNIGQVGIPANYFQNLPLLWRLFLYNNQIDDGDLPDYCFAGIGSSLTVLYLHMNLLTVIRRNQFNGLPNLQELALGNQIHAIESGMLCDSRDLDSSLAIFTSDVIYYIH